MNIRFNPSLKAEDVLEGTIRNIHAVLRKKHIRLTVELKGVIRQAVERSQHKAFSGDMDTAGCYTDGIWHVEACAGYIHSCTISISRVILP